MGREKNRASFHWRWGKNVRKGFKVPCGAEEGGLTDKRKSPMDAKSLKELTFDSENVGESEKTHDKKRKE